MKTNGIAASSGALLRLIALDAAQTCP